MQKDAPATLQSSVTANAFGVGTTTSSLHPPSTAASNKLIVHTCCLNGSVRCTNGIVVRNAPEQHAFNKGGVSYCSRRLSKMQSLTAFYSCIRPTNPAADAPHSTIHLDTTLHLTSAYAHLGGCMPSCCMTCGCASGSSTISFSCRFTSASPPTFANPPGGGCHCCCCCCCRVRGGRSSVGASCCAAFLSRFASFLNMTASSGSESS
jgi:hypothetical protein